MTKATLKEMYKNWNHEISVNHNNDVTLTALKDLNEAFGDGSRWYSWDECLKGIIKGGNDSAINRAMDLYRKHIENETRYEELRKVATATNNFEI